MIKRTNQGTSSPRVVVIDVAKGTASMKILELARMHSDVEIQEIVANEKYKIIYPQVENKVSIKKGKHEKNKIYKKIVKKRQKKERKIEYNAVLMR